jgi:hypothetical protein
MAPDLPKPPHIHLSREADLLILRLEGDYTLDVATYVQAHIASVSDEYGYRLNLIDVSQAGTITADARRFLLENRRQTPMPGAVAVVGASFAVRTLAHMVTRALRALTNAYLGTDFFADETAARTWINTQRNRLRK